MEYICSGGLVLLLIGWLWLMWEIRSAPYELEHWKEKWKGESK